MFYRWAMAILLILLLVGSLPFWPFNSRWKWGWWPSSIFSFLLFIFIVALMMDII